MHVQVPIREDTSWVDKDAGVRGPLPPLEVPMASGASRIPASLSVHEGRSMYYYAEEFGPEGDYRRGAFYETEDEAREEMCRWITQEACPNEHRDLDQIQDYARALQNACRFGAASLPGFSWGTVEEG